MGDTVYPIRSSADNPISGSDEVWYYLFKASDSILRVLARTDDGDESVVRRKYTSDIENCRTVWELAEE